MSHFVIDTLNLIDDFTEEFGGLAGFKTIADNNNNKIISTRWYSKNKI